MYTLDLNDIQGIIIRGYSNLEVAAFLLLGIQNPAAAKQWLSKLQVQNGQEKPSDTSLNIAFTYKGLKALGIDDSTLKTFPTEFQEGMTADHRRRFLGDSGESAPEKWDWGGPKTADVHILLMLYATNDEKLADFYTSLANEFDSNGVQLIKKLDTFPLKDKENELREHFGFRDAIGQPIIEGLSKVGSPANTIKAGEFILGYPNEYGLYTETPRVKAQLDQQDILPAEEGNSGNHDLGRNGSYLVFRQLGQKVQDFWRFLDDKTKELDGTSNPEARMRLAAKMVGRWPSGTPLVKAPDRDNPDMTNKDDFDYHKTDPYGFRCPFSAHIRRSNPRDTLEPEPGSQKSIDLTKKRRLLRRGRTYGAPLVPSLDPQDMLNAQESGERGIHFICINANISRQFEFVQQTWINNPKFNGLYSDTDPLLGDRNPGEIGATDTFTEQSQPVRKRITGLPQFVVVRGGAYFFLPSIRALQYLASIRP